MSQPTPVKLFISYSHKDETYKNRFDMGLKPLKRLNLIDVWQDRQLLAGEEFEKTIFDEIAKAEVICLLVSPHFIDSDYCFSKEMEEALKKRKQGGTSVIPILLRATPLWHKFEIGRLNALPKDGKPVDNWENEDEAWLDVVMKINELVDYIQNNPARSSMTAATETPATAATETLASPLKEFALLRQKVAQGKTNDVIAELIGMTAASDAEAQNSAVLLSTRWNSLLHKENSGTISAESANLERNQIVQALLYLIGMLEAK